MPAPKGNKYAIGNKGGQPPIYKTAKALGKAIDEYFIYILGECHTETRTVKKKVEGELIEVEENVVIWDRLPEPATVTGLVLYLGFAHRQSLADYEEKKEFSDIVRRARTRVENGYEIRLHGQSPTGAMFALKNMGWVDKSETDITTKGEKLNSPLVDMSKLSDEEVRTMANIQRKMNAS